MDDRIRLDTRNWEFSDQLGHAEPILQSASGFSLQSSGGAAFRQQETCLRMSPYVVDRESIAGEHSSHVSDVDFSSWIPQKNFLSPESKCISRRPGETPVDLEMMIDIQISMPPSDEVVIQNPPPKDKKQQQQVRKRASRIAGKALKEAKGRKQQLAISSKKKANPASTGKREKNQDITIGETMLDVSDVPVPVCSCTGVPHQCYRWGSGGWQSSCCTTSVSEHPLPMSTSRPGSRLAGRKMSISAYRKLLQRLAAEGHDLSSAVDLKDHWARHGTNKFVIIR